jgi:serine phosphatase RsbU (regulator of sigma subunit)
MYQTQFVYTFDQVDRFLAGTVQHDDMALLVVKVSDTAILR